MVKRIDRKAFLARLLGLVSGLAGSGVALSKVSTGLPSSAASKAPIWRLGAGEIAEGIRKKSFSCREAVQAHLDRIGQVNDAVNAVTVTLEESALRAAERADAALAAGEARGDLFGVPFTVKENIDLAGSATTEGLVALRDRVVSGDAPHIAQIKQAGAIPIGRTNMPDFGLRFHTANALRGATVNPWNASLTPGGSSGGEAAALATGMTPLGMGNDYGGSLRYPAHCCGIASLRPSRGRVAFAAENLPNSQFPLSIQWFLVQGPMARRVGDLRLALEAMSGPSARDPNWVPAPLRGPAPQRPIRVALCSRPDGGEVDVGVADGVRKAGEVLSDAGYAVEEVDCAGVAEAAEVWATLAASDIRRFFLGLMRVWAAPEALQFLDLLLSELPETDLAEYQNALARRNAIARSWSQRAETHPLVLAPVSTRPPFAVGADLAGSDSVLELMRSMRMLVSVNLLGLPAAVVPVGVKDQTPRAVQVIGPRFREDLCLDAAERIEEAVGIFTPINPAKS